MLKIKPIVFDFFNSLTELTITELRIIDSEAFLVAHLVKSCLTMQETQEMQVRFLGQEDPLEEGMAIHSNILAWKTPWTEGPGRLPSMGHIELDMTEYMCTDDRFIFVNCAAAQTFLSYEIIYKHKNDKQLSSPNINRLVDIIRK